MDPDYIWNSFVEAFHLFRFCDSQLIDLNVYEGAAAHRLAIYLEPFFPDFDVDCEYNKSADSRKELRDPSENRLPEDFTPAQRIHVMEEWRTNSRYGGRGIRPDIIVHHRGQLGLEHNVLAVECKLTRDSFVAAWDRLKLSEFTNGNQPFQYQMGIFAVVGNRPGGWIYKPNEAPEEWLCL